MCRRRLRAVIHSDMFIAKHLLASADLHRRDVHSFPVASLSVLLWDR